MTRYLGMAFAAAAYIFFFATFLYLVAFVGNLPWVPVTVDRGGTASPIAAAIVVDLGLIALFGLQHSGMARRGFKKWWTGLVPDFVERSIYVVASSLVLVVLFLVWRPVDAVIWSTSGAVAGILWAIFAIGWGIVLLSTFLINHFELFGLQQAWFNLRGRSAADPVFRTPLLYKAVRHPLYLGFAIAFWAAPTMTVGHLVFAAGMTAFMLIAIELEEKDLVRMFGARYEDYRRAVGKLLPGIGRA